MISKRKDMSYGDMHSSSFASVSHTSLFLYLTLQQELQYTEPC